MRLLVIFVLLMVVQNATAQTDFFLVPPGDSSMPPLTTPNIPGVEGEWSVRLNLRGIPAPGREKLRLQLPDGSSTVFSMERFSDIAGFILIGKDEFMPDPGLPDSALSYHWYGASGAQQLTIAVWHGHMSATLIGKHRNYAIASRDRSPVLRQFNPTLIPTDFADEPKEDSKDNDFEIASKAEPGPLGTKSRLDTIDVLVVHTPAALAFLGGDMAALNARIDESFLQSDTVMQNSGVTTVRLRNVQTGPDLSTQVNYSENSGHVCDPGANVHLCRWIGHRVWLRTDPMVQSLRDFYGADIVVMLVADQVGAAGVAYTQGPNCGNSPPYETTSGCNTGAAYSGFAFSAVSVNYATSFQVFAHETGHQMGMNHQPGANNSPSYLWSFATVIPGQVQTVMGGISLARSLQYSNPNILFIGRNEASGSATQFNARTAFCLAPAMTGFRIPGQIFTLFWDGFETKLIPAEGC